MAGRFRILAMIAATAWLLILSACSKGEGTQNAAAAADVDLTSVKTVINDFEAEPSLTPPGPAFENVDETGEPATQTEGYGNPELGGLK